MDGRFAAMLAKIVGMPPGDHFTAEGLEIAEECCRQLAARYWRMKYTFIPTERVLSDLIEAGFVPRKASQTQARRASPLHARHVVRLRRRLPNARRRK